MPFLDDAEPAGLAPLGATVTATEGGRPPFSELFDAARYRNTTVGGIAEELARPAASPVDPSYDPFSKIGGYEDHAASFIDANSDEDVARMKRKIDTERRRAELLDSGGAYGVVAEVLAGLSDPVNFIPVYGEANIAARFSAPLLRWGGRVAEGAFRVGRAGLMATAGQEAILQSIQETRSAQESAVNIAAGTLLSGVLGGAIGAGAGVGAFKEGVTAANTESVMRGLRSYGREVGRDLTTAANEDSAPVFGSVGAAATRDTTLAQETLSGALGTEKGLAFASPTLRLANSPSVEVRRFAQELADQPLDFVKNVEGIETPVSVESRIRLWQAPLAEAVTAVDDLFVQHRLGRERRFGDIARIGLRDLGQDTGPLLSRQEFMEEVGRAMRRGDASDIPEVREAAGIMRARVFDPLKERAIAAGLLPADVSVDTALSYLTRVYDLERIKARRPEFENRIASWLDESREGVAERVTGMRDRLGKVEAKRDAIAADLPAKQARLAEVEPEAKKAADRFERLDRALKASDRQYRRALKDKTAAEERAARFAPTPDLERGDPLRTVIRDLRSGGPKEPTRLLQFLRNAGGLKDYQGELAALDVSSKTQPGLIRKDGLNLDDAALRAWEAGYMPEFEERPTIRDFLEALEWDLRGVPRYSARDAEAVAYREYIANLSEQIDKAGLDISKMSDTEAAQTLFGSAPRRVPVSEVGKDGIAAAVRRLIDLAQESPVLPHRLRLGKLGAGAVAKLEAVGIKADGFDHVMEAFDVRHALSRHGEGAPLRDNEIPITADDLARVPEIVDAADEVRIDETKRGHRAAIFSKRDGDAVTYVVVEEVRSGKKRLAFKTMWKTEGKGPGTSDALQRPRATSETEPGTGDNIGAVLAADNAGAGFRENTPAARARMREITFYARRAARQAKAEAERLKKLQADWDEAKRLRDTLTGEARGLRTETVELDTQFRAAKRSAEALAAKVEEERVFAGMEKGDLLDMARQITDQVLGSAPARTAYDAVPLVRGPLKERTLNIPDARIEDFLESDIGRVARIYTRTMAPDVELAGRFGRADMADQVDKIREHYAVLRNGVTDEAALKRLDKQMRADISDLEAVRDRLRGTYGLPEDPSGFLNRTYHVVRDLNYLRLLGGMTVSAIPDAGRTVMVHGLGRVFRDGLLPVITDLRQFRLAANEAKLAGTALDMVLDSRAMALADVLDDYGRWSKFERGLSAMTSHFGLLTLMAPWNAAFKQFVAVISQTRALQAIEGLVKGVAVAQAERTRLASLGIGGDMIARISEQFRAHGTKEGTVWWANTTAWTDGEARDVFRAALAKEVDAAIVTPGQERPLWMTKGIGRVVGQFRSFSFAATQRVMISGLQKRDMAALNGAVLMTGLGALTYWLRTDTERLSNNPGVWLKEGIDRSGLTGWLFDVNNIIERSTGNAVGLSRVIGAPVSSRYASRGAVEALFGPSVGLLEKGVQIGRAAGTGEWTARDTRAVREMVPLQNVFYWRRLLDEAEHGINEAMGVPERRN